MQEKQKERAETDERSLLALFNIGAGNFLTGMPATNLYYIIMHFHIITIFPEMFDSYLKESIIGRGIKEKKISVKFYNPRDFIKAPKNNYRPVDDRPYGGGPGMVMRAEPVVHAVNKALTQ